MVIHQSNLLDPLLGSCDGQDKKSPEEILQIRNKSIALQIELAGLEEDLENLELLNIKEADFLNELKDLETHEDPGFRRFHGLICSLSQEICVEDKILEEFDQKALRERHHHLTEVGQEREDLDAIRTELNDLEVNGTLNTSSIEAAKVEAPAVKQSALKNIPINPEPYNFQTAPKLAEKKGKPDTYEANLASFRRSTRISTRQNFYEGPKYSANPRKAKRGTLGKIGNQNAAGVAASQGREPVAY